MSYHYEPGAVRWKRHTSGRDVRCCAPPKGWEREAMLLEKHPITGRPFRLPALQWWFRDVYKGEDE